MGSTSKTKRHSLSCSDDGLGLKFGQRMYFEEVGIAAQSKPSNNGSSKNGHRPRCQVEGCKLDLSDAKAYYGRHKVCAIHSKTPQVVVNGLHQRFCQQCSRFHQLSEFDQGKRSCRRRLAGHNERRRKPPPGSLFSSPYGRLSSSVSESGKGSGFLMDFSSYPKLTGRVMWPTIRAPSHSTATEKSLPNVWHGDSANPSPNPPSPNPFLQGFSSGTHYPADPTIPSGQCFTGALNSGCALSLLSNQTWDPQVGSSGPFVSVEGAQMVQSTMATTHANQFPSASWGFKGQEDGCRSYEMPSHPGLTRMVQPIDNQYSGNIESNQHRQYVDLKHSRASDSSIQFMNWSL